jgi:GTP cyclohydrolase I
MGYMTVRLDRLADEIEFFARCDAHLAPIIEQTEGAAGTAAHHASTEPQHTPARPARRWLRWFRGSQRDGAS